MLQSSHALFELASELRLMNVESSLPRDLPGPYGGAIADLERLLTATETLAVVAGGWAVWRHGFAGRVTDDVDVVVPEDKLDELKSVAPMCGFEVLSVPPGRWPKMVHRATSIDVDLLPENGIPGTPSRPARIAIQHPRQYAATLRTLHFIPLINLIELKLGAGRAKDIADIIELIQQHPNQLEAISQHLSDLDPAYLVRFQELREQADEEG